eukprot:1217837-Heterocapsa_arctica.AAC.1
MDIEMDLFRDDEDVAVRRTAELAMEQEETCTGLARAQAAKLRFEGAGPCKNASEGQTWLVRRMRAEMK